MNAQAAVVKEFLSKHGGGLFTGIVLALLGCMTQQYLASQAEQEREARLYMELMSRREEAESELRSTMFSYILDASFKSEKAVGLETELFHLELLVGNFHETLNLAPMFWRLRHKIDREAGTDRRRYRNRLRELATAVRDKQSMALAARGPSREFQFYFSLDEDGSARVTQTLRETGTSYQPATYVGTLPLQTPTVGWSGDDGAQLHLLRADPEGERLQVQLRLGSQFLREAGGSWADTASLDPIRWISPFDFPMIENLRLWRGHRCAIVLKELELPQRKGEEGFANVVVLTFPASYASLKERPFLQDVLEDLRGPEPEPRRGTPPAPVPPPVEEVEEEGSFPSVRTML